MSAYISWCLSSRSSDSLRLDITGYHPKEVRFIGGLVSRSIIHSPQNLHLPCLLDSSPRPRSMVMGVPSILSAPQYSLFSAFSRFTSASRISAPRVAYIRSLHDCRAHARTHRSCSHAGCRTHGPWGQTPPVHAARSIYHTTRYGLASDALVDQTKHSCRHGHNTDSLLAD